LLENRLGSLERLTYAQAAQLPETSDENIELCGASTAVTVFRQPTKRGDGVLVTVQVARRRMLATYRPVYERGLIFTPSAAVREATDAEMV
jgi:hypothetical protein